MRHESEVLDAYEEAALELAATAMERIGERRVGAQERSTKKDASDWVTVVDVEVERIVREELAARFGDHVVIGEELGASGEVAADSLVWYVDPIDGTTNFVHGLPWSSFSLCLADDEGLVLGVVADPHRREVFSARRGAGARCNGEPVRCRDDATLVGAAVLAELAGVQCWPGMLEMLVSLSEHQCVSRIMGSSALSLASVGAGRAAAVVLAGSNPIDVGAGVLVAREAGAVVIAGAGAPRVLGAEALSKELLVAVAPGVAAELTDLLEGLPSA